MNLVDEARWRFFNEKQERVETELQRLREARIRPGSDAAGRLGRALERPLSREQNLAELLARPELNYGKLMDLADPESPHAPASPLEEQVAEQIEIRIKYQGYIDRQQDEIERLREQEDTALPRTSITRACPACPTNSGRSCPRPGQKTSAAPRASPE